MESIDDDYGLPVYAFIAFLQDLQTAEVTIIILTSTYQLASGDSKQITPPYPQTPTHPNHQPWWCHKFASLRTLHRWLTERTGTGDSCSP